MSAPAAAAQNVPQVVPRATGDDATLTGVSCLSRAFCVSSGFYIALAKGGTVFGLAEVWNGRQWSTRTVSGFSSGNSDVLDAIAVSCGTPSTCMLVGEHFSNPSRPVQFAEIAGGLGSAPLIWNNPAGAKWSVLDDVKCMGATFCMAVGTYSATAHGGRVLTQLWNGSKWRRLATPSPAKSLNSDLGELYCLSASDCLARARPRRRTLSLSPSGGTGAAGS